MNHYHLLLGSAWLLAGVAPQDLEVLWQYRQRWQNKEMIEEINYL